MSEVEKHLREQYEWSMDLVRAIKEKPPHDGPDLLLSAADFIRDLQTAMEMQAIIFAEDIYPERGDAEEWKQQCIAYGVDYTTEHHVTLVALANKVQRATIKLLTEARDNDMATLRKLLQAVRESVDALCCLDQAVVDAIVAETEPPDE